MHERVRHTSGVHTGIYQRVLDALVHAHAPPILLDSPYTSTIFCLKLL